MKTYCSLKINVESHFLGLYSSVWLYWTLYLIKTYQHQFTIIYHLEGFSRHLDSLMEIYFIIVKTPLTNASGLK